MTAPYRPPFALAWLYEQIFSRIAVDPGWARAVRAAGDRGTVVYITRSRSYLDFLALDHCLKKAALPLIRYVDDLGLSVLQPLGRGLRQLTGRPHGERLLSRAVSEGFSALLFMRKPGSPTGRRDRGEAADPEYMRALLEVQRRSERPILLLPQLFLWGRSPDRLDKGMIDEVFGAQEYPGRLRILAQLVVNLARAELRSCEPLDLERFLAEHPGVDDDALVNKIHWLLVTRLDRERRIALGPVAKGADRMQKEILRSPRLERAVTDLAVELGRPPADLAREAERELRRISARPSPIVFNMWDVALERVFEHIYQGLDVDEEGMQRIREQARKGPVVILPCHKSHLDYLLTLWIFYRHGMHCPISAAGDNLAFFPLTSVIRGGGAFFIRRSFKGQKLHALVVDAYLRKLLKEGYALQIFIEGGRSRTGKLLPAKLGLLSMVVDAAEASGVEVTYVPVGIQYDKVIEEKSYFAERTGAEKKKEGAGSLLRAPLKLIGTYGHAYLRVGEIQALAPAGEGERAAARDAGPGAAARREEAARARKGRVAALARAVMLEVDRVTIITPTALVATALLASRAPAVPRDELLRLLDLLVRELRRAGAALAPSLPGGARGYRIEVIDGALLLLAGDRLFTVRDRSEGSVYEVPDDRRLSLDYYKNGLLHALAPRAFVALAFLPPPGPTEGLTRLQLGERLASLGAAFRREFYLADGAIDQALAALLAEGTLEAGVNGALRPSADGQEVLRLLAGLLAALVDGYRIAARAIGALLDGPLPEKELVRHALTLGKALGAAGEIGRPEAVSRPSLESALQGLRDQGILEEGDGDRTHLAEAYASAAAVREVEAGFAAYRVAPDTRAQAGAAAAPAAGVKLPDAPRVEVG